MRRVLVRVLALLVAVSMLMMSGCGKGKPSSDQKDDKTTATANTTTTTNGDVSTTTATEEKTTTGIVGTSTVTPSSTTGKPTSVTQTKPILTKPTKTGTSAVTPKDPTTAFIATFEEWLLNLTEYKKATPKVVKTKESTITSYAFTGAKNTSDYCVHIHSGTDKSVEAVYVTVKATEYDFIFPVLSYYVYDSLGLTKMDYDAFWEQFDAFPNTIELQNKSESDYRMFCIKPDEFLTFAVLGKNAGSASDGALAERDLQEADCDGCYGDENRALNYMTLTNDAERLGLDMLMLDRALTNSGNRARLANAMRRAQNGEELTIGFIGGSVTEGAFASNYEKTSYAGLTYAWWAKTFPKAKFTFVNAGYGGTSSLYGVHRVQNDVLKYDPDFVVVEFGVNDCDHPMQKEAYADLVHRILSCKSQPAVLLLYVMEDGGSNQQINQEPVGFHYDLPMISYRDAIWPEVVGGVFKWSEIGADWVHPTDKGHAIIAELLISYLTKTREDLANISTKVPALPKPFSSYAYENAVYYNRDNITPLSMNGFRQVSNTKTSWTGGAKATITFEFTGKRCFVIIPAENKDDLDVSIRIDGGAPEEMGAYIFHGGAFANYLVLDEETSAKHTIEIICNSGTLPISGLFVS